MDRNIPNEEDIPMEEDDVEVGGEDIANNDAKRQQEIQQKEIQQGIDVTAGHSQQNESYPTTEMRTPRNEARNSFVAPSDQYIFTPLNQTEVEGNIDEEDMEIQRLTQSLSHLGTGRFQRSLLTDSRIINSGASTSDADS